MSRLAIEGGEPIRAEPFPRRIVVGEEEIDAVHGLMQKERTNGGGFDRYGGEHVDAYEQEFAERHGVSFATATSSGTAAIHAALGALRLSIAREVISSPITDPGGVAPILWNNCIPIFADADPDTMNIDPASVAERVSDRTAAIIVAHIAGQPVDLDPILAIAREKGIPIIEDCSQAHGALYNGRQVGTMGDIGAFSLMGGKHHTAGGQGGMVITNDESIYWDAKRFADRGKPFNSLESKNLFLGLNYRMTEIEAVIGRVQLGRLPDVIARRRALAAELADAIADLQAIRIGKVIPNAVSSYWFLLLRIDCSRLSKTKEQVAAAIAAEGIPINPHYDWIVFESPWFRHRATYGDSQCPWSCPHYGKEIEYADSCPNARRAIDTHMVLSWHEGLSSGEIADIAAALHKVEAAYLRR